MTDNELTSEEIDDLFQGHAAPIEVNEDDLAVALALRDIRSALASAAEEDEVGSNKLARRLGVSPSVVSRMVHSEGDMRVSTAVLWARALGREWTLNLSKIHSKERYSNFDPKWLSADKSELVAITPGTSSPNIQTVNLMSVQKFSFQTMVYA